VTTALTPHVSPHGASHVARDRVCVDHRDGHRRVACQRSLARDLAALPMTDFVRQCLLNLMRGRAR
jgi:hypothetical protein